MPWVTPLAAIGLALTMVGGIMIQARHVENVSLNVVLMANIVFLAYGLLLVSPIS